MAKLFKRDGRGTSKKAGGKLRAYIAEGRDDRLCICIHGSSNEPFEYILRIGDAEAAKLKIAIDEYLIAGARITNPNEAAQGDG